ncbi:class I SAM-dependent methyltransferase [Pseudoduganella violacea]|uniref:2-polyprenyl-3-methyl-5-hydroxy-6-metoxy-1, 4-benzoquinol methylase n=1 Tax=Pseudoduganella violacea TaxID=1715466 RepID=A0A7W5BDS9_9BURK|nr:class I SAM-dependent methyltransferase [Pseudoduganella violacea]MBB3121319.1 2-polyprenyl-3-methyl-5-hydroxy-6-metoxy-1,4-benzoquinol methylase [Pseudoduganella violacea]
MRAENFRIIVDRVSRLAPQSAARLLDVGSAHGWFLEQASSRFEVLGIEPDQVVGERAAARGLPVRLGYFPDVLERDERFDVIVFNDVIEHIPDIGSALDACHARLNPGGLLVLNLPSSRGVFYRLSKLFARFNLRGPFERMWQKDLPSPHVHYFNEANLRALVGRHGFEEKQGFELASLKASGLLERLRFTGGVHPAVLYAQYIVLRCVIPFLNLLPSDIVVGIYRRKD